MRLFPEQRKRTILSITLLLVSVAGIVYINVLRSGKAPAAVRSDGEVYQTTPKPTKSQGLTSQKPGAPKPVAKRARGGLLPYGAKIDESILEQEKFRILKTSPTLEVSPEQLGKDDPFSN